MGNVSWLAIDGALDNFGLAWGTFNGRIQVEGIQHIHTKKIKPNVRLNDAKRCQSIYKQVKRHQQGKNIVLAEICGGSQSASAAFSLGCALGIICSLDCDIIWVTATQVKSATGNKKASKSDMIKWATKKHPNLNWFYKKNGDVLLSKDKYGNSNEHCADAIAIAEYYFSVSSFYQFQ